MFMSYIKQKNKKFLGERGGTNVPLAPLKYATAVVRGAIF